MVSRVIPVDVFDLVIFGGTGDLARRKILPGLYRRYLAGQMPGDSRIIGAARADLTDDSFRQQVREAMDQRREHHIAQGDATRQQNGRILYRRNLLANLREREVARVGAEMASSKGLPFRAAADGENISGKFTGTAHLSSGKFAIVEKSHEFTLVPWRPVIDRQIGREVAGIVQGGSVSWQLGRTRGLSV